ncbi:MAG TPA: PDZ domain-containing protein [Thermoanaerobaculia bacterium]
MRRTAARARAAAAVAALLAALAAPPAAGQAAVPPEAVAAARDAVYPSLVNLTVVDRSFFAGRAVRQLGSGSGVIVSPEGHVLTNYHVAGQSTRITATLTTGEQLEAEVVAHDPPTDLSVLRLVPPHSGRRFPAAALGDSAALEVGQPVLAMGNPLALASSVTLGIVGNPRRVFTDATGSELAEPELAQGLRTGLFTRWIQHDALILPGNSGGPLVDLAGRVVGINELGGSGLGFAIPSNVARRVLAQAIESGEVRRGWLGFSVLPVEKLGREDGALVAAVAPESPAAAAGLEPGDVLLALAGEPVTVRFLEEIPTLYGRIAELAPGEEVTLEVERGSGGELERRRLAAEVAAMEPAIGEEAEVAEVGVTVQEVTGPMALDQGLPSAAGLLVTGVRPGGALEAARPPLAPGDVLLTYGDRVVDSPADLAAAVAAAGSGATAVTFRRGGEELVGVVARSARAAARMGGELPAAWLGVRTQVVGPELAAALGLPAAGGFRLTEVFPWTTAAEAGLAVGDVVVALDDEELAATRAQEREDLRRAVERRSPGETVTLALLRRDGDGEAATWQRREIEIELEPKPEEASSADRYRQPDLELAVRDVTFLDRIERRWDRDQDGVVVVEVEPGSWAHLAGLRLGDLVLRVAGEPVADVDAFRRVLDRVVAGRPEVIPVFLRRGRRTHFVFIEPEESR